MFMPRRYRKLARGPQVILPKDIGLIIAYSGVGKESVCVDAGTGSGWLAVSLARLCKSVVSYDVREDFLGIAGENIKRQGVDNLKLVLGDVTKGIKERDVDLVTLDMPNAEKAVRSANAALRPGGCIVGYLPHMEQVKAFVERLNRYGFEDTVTLEAIVRDMLVRAEGVRPSTKGVWHTGYLVFAHKAGQHG